MTRTLAQTCGRVLKLVQAGASGDETVDRPAGEAEQPQLLARGRVHRQPVGVVGIPLRAAHLLGVAVAPDRALAQKPVRRQPRAREHDRRPPRISGEDHGGRDAADHLDHAGGDEIHGDRQRRAGHPEVEVARDGEVAGERRILEVPHARRAHAGLGEPVVEPGGGAVAEVGADRLMNRAEHLEQHEDRAGKRERTGETDRRAARRRRARPSRSRTPPAGSLSAGGPIHQAAARPGSAFGRTAKNFHSLRSVSRWSTTAFCLRTGATHTGERVVCPALLRSCRQRRRQRHSLLRARRLPRGLEDFGHDHVVVERRQAHSVDAFPARPRSSVKSNRARRPVAGPASRRVPALSEGRCEGRCRRWRPPTRGRRRLRDPCDRTASSTTPG